MTRILDPMVVTNHGIKKVSDLTIYDDCLIEYKTNKIYKVSRVEIVKCDMLLIKYNDGTVYRTGSCYHIEDINKSIKLFPVDFHSIYDTLNPDPYSAGALLIYGDLYDKYMNLPYEKCTVDNFIRHKYNMSQSLKLNGSKVYYRYQYMPEEYCITWNEFFKDHKCVVTKNNIINPIIPYVYTQASIDDRRKLLSGIFDFGYNMDEWPNDLCIVHKDENRLKIVQLILRSMGVLSIIRYLKNDVYILQVVGSKKDSIKFFYDVENMYNAIYKYDKNSSLVSPYELRVSDIRNEGFCMCYIPITEDNIVFLNSYFIPIHIEFIN